MNAWWNSPENAWQLAGWTMLHFLWIGAAVAAVGAVVRAALRRTSPTLRYATSLTTLAALAVAPVAVAAWLAANAFESRRDSATVGEFLRSEIRRGENSQSESRSDEAAPPIDLAHSPLPFTSAPSGPLAPLPDVQVGAPTPPPAAPRPLFDATEFGNSESLLQQAVELLPCAWLVGAPLTFAFLAAGLIGSRRLQRSSSPLVEGPIAEACQRLKQALGVTRRVALAVCDGLAQPVLVGVVKPTILLPAAAVTGWTPEELEMALVHELAHVRRWDNLVNLAQRVVESLLFFHPAVWLVSRQVRRDREECCDAIVVAQTRQPEAYATLLVSIATKLRARPAAALAVASAMANHALAGRVRRILKLEDQPMWISRRWLAALLLIALGLTTAVYSVAVAEPAADKDDAKVAAADDESADSAPRKLTPEQGEELHGLAEPGDVPAAVFVFPATPEEISRRVDELNWLGHNVRIDNGDGFTVLFIKDLNPKTFRRPHRLVPDNVILVRVLGALADMPIDDTYTVEEEGTIALGPAYGRVAVEGLTVLEAEAAITEHLSTILSDAQVQVTLIAREADYAAPQPALDDFASDNAYAGSTALEVRRLEAEIRHGQLLLARFDAELNEIEDLKEAALQRAKNPAILEDVIEAELERDPILAALGQEIAALDARIRQLNESLADHSDQLAEFQAERAELTRARNVYRQMRDRELREHFAQKPNEQLRAAIVEYQARSVSTEDEKAEVEQRLAAAQARLEELVGEPVEEGGDGGRDATAREEAEQAADADPTPAADVEDELSQIEADIRLCQTQLILIQSDLVEAEVMKELALQRARSQGALDEAVEAKLEKDPTIIQYQQQLFGIQQQLQELQSTSRSGQNAEIRQLQATYAQIEAEMEQYQEQAEKEVRERLARTPNEELRAAVAEYQTRYEALMKQKADVEQRLQALRDRVEELSSGPDVGAGGGDAPARGEDDGDAEHAAAAAMNKLVVPFPTQTSDREAERIAEELREDGLEAKAVREGGKLFLEVSIAAENPRIVWHETIADGRRQLHARVVVEPAAGAGGADAPLLFDEHGQEAQVGHVTVSKDGPLQSVVGQSVVFRITVRNDGQLPLTDVEVFDEYPPGLLRVRPPAGDSNLQISGDVIRRVIPRLEVGQSQTFEVECQCVQAARPVLPTPLVRVRASTDPPTAIVETFDDHALEILPPRVGRATTDGAFDDPQLDAGGGDAPARAKGEGLVDLAAPPIERDPSAVESYNVGVKMLAEGAYRDAIKAFNQAIAVDATFAEAHIGKGDALKALGYYPEAAQSYSRALEIDSRLSAAYTGRGLCFMMASPPDYDLAVNDFQNALDLDRDNVVALASMGRIYARSDQDAQRAIAFLSEALQLDAKNDGLYRSRAHAYLLIGAYDKAENDAEIAVDLNPADPENEAMLARVRDRRQQAAQESSADARQRDLDRYVEESADDESTDYRYDGKTFDEWRNLWRHELKTERRIEAIAALTAFGRTAYPQEAAEAILDVAGEYDFTHDVDGPESDLKESVVRAFSYGGVNGIAPAVWLPILVERVRESDGAEQRRWRDLLSALLMAWGHASPEHVGTMMELAEDEAVGVQEGAVYVLARNSRDLSDPELVRMLRESLTGARPSIRVLERLGFRDLDQIPEQFDLLLHDDPQVQAAARRVMQRYNAKHEPWSDLYNRLVAVLDDPNRADDHLAAMRAIAALHPYLKANWSADTELLMRHHRALATGDESLVATTLWLLTKLNGADAQYVIERTREMLPEEFTDDRAKLARDAVKHLEAEERAIFGQ